MHVLIQQVKSAFVGALAPIEVRAARPRIAFGIATGHEGTLWGDGNILCLD